MMSPGPTFSGNGGTWGTADRYPHEPGSTDVLTSGEGDDRMMTGGLHSVRPAGCHSLVDSAAWVTARVIPMKVQNRDRGLRTQQRATGGKMGIEQAWYTARAW